MLQINKFELEAVKHLPCEDIHVEYKDGSATFTSQYAGMEMRYKTTTLDNEQSGVFMFPTRLIKTVKSLSGCNAVIINGHLDNKVELQCGQSTFSFSCLFDFERIKERDVLYTQNVEGIKKVSQFASSDPLKMAFNGVYAFDGGICATDSNTLILKGDFEQDGTIIPLDFIKHLPDDVKELSFTDGTVIFESDTLRLEATLINANYPNVANVIPHTTIQASFNAEHMIAAINAVNTVSRIGQMVFKFNTDSVSISSFDLDVGAEGEVFIDCKCSRPIEIGFNSKYLLRVLKSLGKEWTFGMTGKKTAAMFESEGSKMIVVPVVF